jgi:hypothetical protein
VASDGTITGVYAGKEKLISPPKWEVLSPSWRALTGLGTIDQALDRTPDLIGLADMFTPR